MAAANTEQPPWSVRTVRTLALAVLLTSAGCAGGDAVDPADEYAFEPGHYDPDSVRGLARLDAQATRGDADAQFQVVVLRQFMAGDRAGALDKFERLAEQGHADATEMVAASYLHGWGVAADDDTAAVWMKRAAALGSESAARDLAAYRAHRGAFGQ